MSEKCPCCSAKDWKKIYPNIIICANCGFYDWKSNLTFCKTCERETGTDKLWGFYPVCANCGTPKKENEE